MENPIKMDDLGVPLFLETPIYPIYKKVISSLFNPQINPKEELRRYTWMSRWKLGSMVNGSVGYNPNISHL